MKPDPSAELQRDVAAAQAELRARCDQAVADLEQRQQQLAAFADEVAAGTLELRAAQAAIRKLVADRGGIVGAARAGRTTLGKSAPHAPPPTPATPRLAPTATLVEAAVSRAAAQVGERLARVLLEGRGAADRGEARVELSLLTHLRRALDRQAGQVPPDPVLAASVTELCDETLATLAILEAGGAPRVLALIDHVRSLVTQLLALGTPAPGAKEQLQRARALVAAAKPELAAAVGQTVSAFSLVTAELERRHPASASGLVDELWRT